MTRIMILDAQENSLVMRKALTRLGGYEVTTPGSDAEALAAARTGDVSLVVANMIHEWGLSGWAFEATVELVRRITSDHDTAGLPVLIVVGGVADAEAERLRAACGADAVLGGPYIEPKSLVAKVRELLARG